jgi:hypothetical protein
VVCAIAGTDTRAPLAIAQAIANGKDFNLNVINTSPFNFFVNGFFNSPGIFVLTLRDERSQ